MLNPPRGINVFIIIGSVVAYIDTFNKSLYLIFILLILLTISPIKDNMRESIL